MAGDTCDLLCLDLEVAEAVRGELPGDEAIETLAARAKALADPTRVRIAWALQHAGAPLCVCDLAWIVRRAENLVSHHVRTLRAAGLASSQREGKMVLYRLTAAGEQLLAATVPPAAR